MQEVEITVNSHFTEKGAQQFIDRKQHDYPKLYIYAISLCYVEQMRQLRDWIKGLSEEQNCDNMPLIGDDNDIDLTMSNMTDSLDL